MKKLRIADNLTLPLDFVTERIAFLARTGAGKSGGMRVLFEEFLEAKQFVVFLDPKGDAWGVRAAGIGSGYPVLVMGGDHGDVPLEPSAGKVVAEFLVKERVSTVLDVSDFGKAGMIRFVTDLATTLYRRNRDVLQFMMDEADMVAGEKFYDPHCLEAIQLIQNKGRHRGFGVTVATQRSAMINKTVLYASGTLVAMQTTSPKDIKTIRDWLEVVATAEAAKQIVSALPTLRTREALVYSPQYLGSEPTRITFKTFRTFDSMRTPKPGETRQQPKSLADIDLSAVQEDMAATIEKFKAEDPKELNRKIKELQQQLARAPVAAASSNGAELKSVNQRLRQSQAEVSGLRKALQEAMKFIVNINAKDFFSDNKQPIDETAITQALTGAVNQIKKLIEVKLDSRNREVDALRKDGQRIISRLQKLLNEETMEVDVTVKHNEPFSVQTSAPAAAPRERRQASVSTNGNISKSQQRILNALSWLESVGVSPVVKKQVALMAEMSPTSGGFFNNLGSLRSAGLIDYPTAGNVALTDEGRAVAEVVDVPTSSEDLQRQVCSMVSGSQSSILREAIAAYPEQIQKSELAEKAGQSPTSGGYFNNLGRLRSLGLIDYPQSGYVKASPVLFLRGKAAA